MFTPDEFPRTAFRRRLLVAALAVVMAIFLIFSVTRKSGVVRDAQQRREGQPPADVPDCAAGQITGCVGSRTQIIVAPPVVPASR